MVETTGECLTYTDYTETELKTLIKKESEKFLEKFAEVSINRDSEQEDDTKVLGGSVTISEKK